MALVIKDAQIAFAAYPGGATTAEIHYRVVEETTPDLGRTGIVRVELSTSLRAQLATLIEDGLRAAGKL